MSIQFRVSLVNPHLRLLIVSVTFLLCASAIPGPQDLDWPRGVRGPKVQVSMAWLEKFSSEFGDKMPDSDRIHLPSSMSRKDVYDRMYTKLTEAGEEPQPYQIPVSLENRSQEYFHPQGVFMLICR